MNLFSPVWDAELPTEGGVLRAVRLAAHAGATRIAANLYELEGHTEVSPLHFHHANEELLFVLAGTPVLRTGSEERALVAGEIVVFPTGPSGTHQLGNRASEPARVLICATAIVPDVAEQPETDRVAVVTSDGLRVFPNPAATIVA